jgi:hypothetical protein
MKNTFAMIGLMLILISVLLLGIKQINHPVFFDHFIPYTQYIVVFGTVFLVRGLCDRRKR